MKVLKMITAAALAAVFILSLCACGKSEMMRPKLKKDGVDAFVSALGSGEAKNCCNVTPDDAEGFSVFKFADTGKAYAYADGRITPLSDKEGGVGYISGVGCGEGRLIYTYSYEEDGNNYSAAFFDKNEEAPVILLTSRIPLCALKQTTDIIGMPDDYGIYFALVEQYKNKADIGIAIGSRAGTVEVGAHGAVFTPDPATSPETVGKIVYENVKKVIVMSVDAGYESLTYTEKSDIDRVAAFLQAIKTGGDKRETPGDAGTETFVISLFYEDGKAGIVYIVGEYVKFGSDGYYKIISGGDVSEILNQSSSETKK